MSLAPLASALWAAVQAISGYSPSTFLYGAPRVEVPNGLFANRNHLAALLVTSLPVVALIALSHKGARTPHVVVTCAGLAGFVIMMALTTGSRAGMALCAASMIASILIWRARPRRSAGKTRTHRKNAMGAHALAGFGAAFLAGIAFLLTQTTGYERLVRAGSGEVEEFRFTVWLTVADFAPAYMPLGSGIGSFVEVFKIHEPDEMLAQSYWNHAHNDWLEWAMEGGVPALCLMMAAVVAWAMRSIDLVRNSHRGRIEIQLGLAGAIILLVLGAWSLVDYPLRTPALASLSALCAVWMGLPDLGRSRSVTGEESGFERTRLAER